LARKPKSTGAAFKASRSLAIAKSKPALAARSDLEAVTAGPPALYLPETKASERFWEFFQHPKQECAAGSKYNYSLTFPVGQLPPVNAFWSVTMYNGKTQPLVANPINRGPQGVRAGSCQYGGTISVKSPNRLAESGGRDRGLSGGSVRRDLLGKRAKGADIDVGGEEPKFSAKLAGNF
jgi:Protein of unknown function (DUF1214)